MNIQIGTMQPEDLAQIQIMYQELVPHGCPMEILKQNYEKTYKDSRYVLLTAKSGGNVLGSAIGIVCIALDTPFLVVENVIVRQDCRRKGVGRTLFDELDRFAKENDCGYAILASSGYRKEAHKFYEAVGYDDDVRGFRKCYK